MCGIFGYIGKLSISKEEAENINNTLSHRGPDDSGVYIDFINNQKQIVLTQRRLSIFDLSPLGHQPMLSNDGRVVVVYNGEIYNFIEIKNDLIKKGYTFNSECDTEVIIKGYIEYGINVISKFNGMFAIALFDRENNELFLVRDRMGVKPLYYYFDGENFAFASELKPITKLPFFKKDINQDSLGLFLVNQYIPAPNTIYKNTYKLEQGNVLKFNGDVFSISTYWSIIDKFNNRKIESCIFDECRDNLERLIEDSVGKRMLADVPVGIFLSGGIDSTLIALLAQKSRTNPINTFTIGFYEDEYNEATFAEEISKFLGTNHYQEYCSINDVKDLITNIPYYFDEPFADSSQLPTMLVSKLAKQKVTVALSGDAGDELFCGYNTYDHLLMQKKTLWLGKIFSRWYNLHITGDPYLWKLGKILKPTNDNDILIVDANNTLDITKTMFKNKQVDFNYLLNYAKIIKTGNLQEKKMVLDMISYLPDNILVKVDRASMKYSLETRNPLLDYRVVEYSFNIPHEFKYKKGIKKFILKEILYKNMPREIIDRPKKGFSIPINKWLHNDLKPLVFDLLNEKRIRNQEIFDTKSISNFRENFSKTESRVLNDVMWNMLMFQLWYDVYIK